MSNFAQQLCLISEIQLYHYISYSKPSLPSKLLRCLRKVILKGYYTIPKLHYLSRRRDAKTELRESKTRARESSAQLS